MSKRSHRSRENQRRRGEHSLTLDGTVYCYHIGRTYVIIRDLARTKLWFPLIHEVKGAPAQEYFAEGWEHTADGGITPDVVSSWIALHRNSPPVKTPERAAALTILDEVGHGLD